MKQVIGTILTAFGRVLIGLLVILVLVGAVQQTRFGLRIGFGYAVVVSGSMLRAGFPETPAGSISARRCCPVHSR